MTFGNSGQYQQARILNIHCIISYHTAIFVLIFSWFMMNWMFLVQKVGLRFHIFWLYDIFCDCWYCIRTLPRGGIYWVVHPQRPRDFPRPERCPEGEARGTSRGWRGCTTQFILIRGSVRPFSHHLSIPRDVSGNTSPFLIEQWVSKVLKSILPC